jgi:hypothetical protein
VIRPQQGNRLVDADVGSVNDCYTANATVFGQQHVTNNWSAFVRE